MKLKKSLLTGAVVACFATAASAQFPDNGYIGVFSDAAGTQCCATVPQFAPTDLFVIAKLGGATANGITGAEFRLEFDPAISAASVFATWNAQPGSTVIGDPTDRTPGNSPTPQEPPDPMDDAGANVAFGICQPDPPGSATQVTLGRLSLLALQPLPPTTVRVKRKEPSSNPNNSCPLFVLCDIPNFTAVCTTIRQTDNAGEEPIAFVMHINTTPCDPASCPRVAVEEATWSTMKGLYRN